MSQGSHGWGRFGLQEVRGTGGTQVHVEWRMQGGRWEGEPCQCRNSQGNLARDRQSDCRSHNPAGVKDNALEGEQERKG